ncbi:hypothetical protein [Pontimicrobium sp. MEBiC01747]
MDTQEQIEKLTTAFENDLKALTNEISKEVSNIEDDSEILEDNQSLFSIKNGDYQYNFEWKEVSFHLPIPEFSMREKRIVFHIPEVVMKNKDISFKVPTTIMKDKKIGEKPETTCKWKIGWILGVKTKKLHCTTKMTPIIISVPEIHMKLRKIVTKIPEITMKENEVILDLPEVVITNKLIKFNTLVITDIKYEQSEENVDESSEAINNSQIKINALTTSYENKMSHLQVKYTNEEFDKAEAQLRLEMEPHSNKYNSAIEDLKNTIRDLKSNNANEQLKQEEKKLNTLIEEMNTFLTPYKNAIEALNNQRNQALDKLTLA